MSMKRLAAGGIAALLIAVPAAAQQPRAGSVEIGAFGSYTSFDSRFRLDDGVAFGGRLGVFLSKRWAIEGDAAYGKIKANDEPLVPGAAPRPCPQPGVCGKDWNYTPLYLRLAYNVPVGNRSQVILGAHVVRLDYDFTHETGFGALLGTRIGLSPSVAIRLDAIGDWNNTDAVTPDNDDTDITITGRAGLSLMLRTRRPAPPPPPPPVIIEQPVQPAPPPPPPPPPAPTVDTAGIAAQVTSAMAEKIFFDFDRSDLRDEARSTLDRKIGYFQANPSMRIRISGHADERGSDEYNLALGQRRAAAAKTYLVQQGIDAGRIDIVSYGEERPVCTESNEACWQQNRRDEFEIIAGGPLYRLP